MPMLWREAAQERGDRRTAASPAMNRRTSPKRRVSQPVSGSAIALLTANEVMTQVPWSATDAEVAGDGRQRHVGDRRVEHLHERRQRQCRAWPARGSRGRNGGAPWRRPVSRCGRRARRPASSSARLSGAGRPCSRRMIARRSAHRPAASCCRIDLSVVSTGSCGGALRQHRRRCWSCRSTSTLIDRPTRSGCSPSSFGSSAMRTGTRCTILIQLPVAFCAGSSENALPVPAPRPATLPWYVDRCRRRRPASSSHRLADAHVGQLGFLEVGVDPDLVQRHDRHQRRAGLHALAELHACAWRRSRRPARRIGARAARGRPRAAAPRRPARSDGRCTAVRIDQRAAARELLLRRADSAAARGVERVARVLQLFGRDRARVATRPLRRADVRARLAAAATLARLRRRPAPSLTVAYRVRTWRTVCASCASACSSATCASPGSSCTSAWPALDDHGVVGADADDGAGDLRRDLHDVALHVGVVGALVPAADEVVQSAHPIAATTRQVASTRNAR